MLYKDSMTTESEMEAEQVYGSVDDIEELGDGGVLHQLNECWS